MKDFTPFWVISFFTQFFYLNWAYVCVISYKQLWTDFFKSFSYVYTPFCVISSFHSISIWIECLKFFVWLHSILSNLLFALKFYLYLSFCMITLHFEYFFFTQILFEFCVYDYTPFWVTYSYNISLSISFAINIINAKLINTKLRNAFYLSYFVWIECKFEWFLNKNSL